MYQTVWKASGQSGKFLDSLESFWTFWKVSGESGKFLDSLENIRTVLKSFQTVSITSCYMSHGKHLMFALLAHLCCKFYLRTYGGFLSQKQFLRSLTGLLSESFCALYSADRKVLNFCGSYSSGRWTLMIPKSSMIPESSMI